MKTLEEKDKVNFEKIIEDQESLISKLDTISNLVKDSAVDDRSGIFARAYPPNPNMDSCYKIYKEN